MPEKVSIQDVGKMLNVARFHLRGYESELRESTSSDSFAMEAFLVACLQAGGAVFYTLSNRDKGVVNPFAGKARNWKRDLAKARKGDSKFFFRMIGHRNSTVHVSIVATEVATLAFPARLAPDAVVSAAPGTALPNPVPGGSPAFAQAWVSIANLRLDGTDALSTFKRFLNLLDELVKYCRVP